MMRPTTLILFVLSVVAGGVLFGIAFEVSTLEERLIVVNQQITDDREAIHVLRAEWSYLNQPERLEELSQRYLELRPLEGGQIANVAALPARQSRDPKPADPVPADIAAAQLPALAAQLALALKARPKAKPAAPRRPARHVELASQPLPAPTAQATGVAASDTPALDAALRAIFGNAASSATGTSR